MGSISKAISYEAVDRHFNSMMQDLLLGASTSSRLVPLVDNLYGRMTNLKFHFSCEISDRPLVVKKSVMVKISIHSLMLNVSEIESFDGPNQPHVTSEIMAREARSIAAAMLAGLCSGARCPEILAVRERYALTGLPAGLRSKTVRL